MRIEAVFAIEVPFQVSDTGYTRTMTLPEIETWAKERMRSITVLLKEGGTEPKAVAATISLQQIRFTPDDQRCGGNER